MASNIPKRKPLKAPSSLTDDEKIQALETRPETGARPKLMQKPNSKHEKTRITAARGSKASSSNQIEKKVNSRAAHCGMVLKLNPKKVTIVEPVRPRKIQEKETESVRGSILKKTPLSRSLSFSEKSGKHQEAITNTISNSKIPSIDKVSVKSPAKSLTSGTKSNDKSKKMNRSRTEPIIKLDKAAAKKEIKSTEKTVENPLNQFLSSEFSGSMTGKISPNSNKTSIAHSGLKFIPKARKKKSYLNSKREVASQEPEHKAAKCE